MLELEHAVVRFRFRQPEIRLSLRIEHRHDGGQAVDVVTRGNRIVVRAGMHRYVSNEVEVGHAKG